MALLPSFYRRWLPRDFEMGWLKTQPSDEPEAPNCASCEMLRPQGYTRDLGPFREDIKCCTYHPFLPSFTIGDLPESAALNRYLETSRLTPLGAFSKRKPTSVCETGKHDSDRCPFVSSDARCTIWSHRPSTCAGYSCRGRDFKALQKWEARLASFEWTLAHATLLEMGYTMDEAETEFPDSKTALDFYKRAFFKARNIRLAPSGDWVVEPESKHE